MCRDGGSNDFSERLCNACVPDGCRFCVYACLLVYDFAVIIVIYFLCWLSSGVGGGLRHAIRQVPMAMPCAEGGKRRRWWELPFFKKKMTENERRVSFLWC